MLITFTQVHFLAKPNVSFRQCVSSKVHSKTLQLVTVDLIMSIRITYKNVVNDKVRVKKHDNEIFVLQNTSLM